MRVISGTARGHQLKAPHGMTTRPMSDKIKGAVFSMLANLLEGLDRDWGRVLDLYSGTGSIGIEALSRGASWADFVEINAGVCRIISANLEHTRFQERARVNNRNVVAFLNKPPASPGVSASKREAGGLHRRKGGERREQPETLIGDGILPQTPPTTPLPVAVAATQEQGQYDIIFLDPPYADPKIPGTITHLAISGLVKDGGLVVIGHSPRVALDEIYSGQIAKDKKSEASPRAVNLKRIRFRRHGDSAFSIYLAGDPLAYGLEPVVPEELEQDYESEQGQSQESI